jgi:NAD(P)-dependent dehydrogenase (short-subunit alcohol dehydrogenase family)
MKLENSVIIVTGASSGIGATTARMLAQHGSFVVLAARRADYLEALAQEIDPGGKRILAIPTDITRREDIDRLISRTIEIYGRIDVLINNAGVGGGSAIATSDDAQLQAVLDVNLLGPARCVQAAAPHMLRQGSGVIVNIGSVAGEVAVLGIYSAAKFGLRGLNDALRREFRQSKIAVVLIEPGFIRTPMTEGLTIPMPPPEAVAQAIIRAIQRPRRRVFVPWYYLIGAYIAKLFPWLADWILGSNRLTLRRCELN